MNFSVNGQSQVPPGFRFHPTEEELLHYYLRKKVASKKIDLDVIRDVDLNKLEPWDIQEKCRIGSTPQNDWYFFSHKDKKYPTGTRTNRATAAGFWKATGRDKVIYSNSKRIGMRKTLVFYKGRAPHGQKSDWIMHEYRLDDNTHGSSLEEEDQMGCPEDGWVVCRVFKKKNYHKAVEGCQSSPTTSLDSRSLGHHHHHGISGAGNSNNKDGILDRILGYMGRSCKQDTMQILTGGNNTSNLLLGDHNSLLHHAAAVAKSTTFIHLPRLLENPWPSTPTPIINDTSSGLSQEDGGGGFGACEEQSMSHVIKNTTAATLDEDCPKILEAAGGGLTDWVALDRLVASQLNATHDYIGGGGGVNREEIFSFPLLHDQHQAINNTCLTGNNNLRSSSICNRSNNNQVPSSDQVYMMVNNGEDFWSFAGSPSSSSSDPLCHLSV